MIAVLIIQSRKNAINGNDALSAEKIDSITHTALEAKHVYKDEITIPIERLPATTKFDKKSLFEITDSTVIARISETIPLVAETLAKTITNKALKKVKLYKAIIPSGATLAESKKMEGAVRGIYHGAKGVKGHANLVKVDPAKISKATTVANGVANVMNVGSLVVGQYYMSEINSKIAALSKGVNKISDFQERELKSRILSLIALVGKISRETLINSMFQ